MTLTKEQRAERATDHPPRSERITGIEDHGEVWLIETKGAGFSLSKDYGITPIVGDEVAVYTTQGSLVRGIDLNGQPVFFKTDAELEIDHEIRVARMREEQEQRWREKGREKFGQDFASLPDVFRRRIAKFMVAKPGWEIEYGGYEMSCCVDAVKIAEAMVTPNGVASFREMPYERQREAVPDLYDGHSGNSFGFAMRLAWLYLKDPALVVLEHGALVPLVGCDAYGCLHEQETGRG